MPYHHINIVITISGEYSRVENNYKARMKTFIKVKLNKKVKQSLSIHENIAFVNVEYNTFKIKHNRTTYLTIS